MFVIWVILVTRTLRIKCFYWSTTFHMPDSRKTSLHVCHRRRGPSVKRLVSNFTFYWISLSLSRPLTSNRHHRSYDDCLENKGRLQDCSCSIGSYHCIQCYAHILWAAPTGQTDLSLSHWVHFTVLRCICVFVFSCISLHACCIIVTRWGGPGGIETWSDDWPSSFSALTLLVGSHDL